MMRNLAKLISKRNEIGYEGKNDLQRTSGRGAIKKLHIPEGGTGMSQCGADVVSPANWSRGSHKIPGFCRWGQGKDNTKSKNSHKQDCHSL